jgi:hypothetical protein
MLGRVYPQYSGYTLVEGVTGGGDGAVDGALWGYVGVIGGLRVRGSCCRYHGRSWAVLDDQRCGRAGRVKTETVRGVCGGEREREGAGS